MTPVMKRRRRNRYKRKRFPHLCIEYRKPIDNANIIKGVITPISGELREYLPDNMKNADYIIQHYGLPIGEGDVIIIDGAEYIAAS